MPSYTTGLSRLRWYITFLEMNLEGHRRQALAAPARPSGAPTKKIPQTVTDLEKELSKMRVYSPGFRTFSSPWIVSLCALQRVSGIRTCGEQSRDHFFDICTSLRHLVRKLQDVMSLPVKVLDVHCCLAPLQLNTTKTKILVLSLGDLSSNPIVLKVGSRKPWGSRSHSIDSLSIR